MTPGRNAWLSTVSTALIISGNEVYTQIGFLSAQEVTQADALPHVPYKPGELYVGGSFWDTLKNIGSFIKENKLISKGAQLASQFVPQLAPIASTVGNVAESLGFGVGGARMSKQQLRRNLHEF